MHADLASQPRRAGILLHPTSLPASGREAGIGDIGPAARAFADWLASAGQRIWQLLPLNVVDDKGCPYASESAFAHEPLLISLEDLVEEGHLSRAELERADLGTPEDTSRVSYAEVAVRKGPLLTRAASNVLASVDLEPYAHQNPELSTWALYRALSIEQRRPWYEWPHELRDRSPGALSEARERLGSEIKRVLALQWLFDRQWARLRAHTNARGIELWGDVPIFVGRNCADVWSRPQLWRLDEERAPVVVSGVPPDAFSETGQLWGHPLYDNAAHAAEGYAWWRARLARALSAVDRVRIDHFRGFEAVWEIPRSAKDAREGRWVPGLGRGLLDALQKERPDMPFIAEDLGVITDEVRALRDGYRLPGMAILQFAFGGHPDARDTHNHPYLPHAHKPNQVCYTGTHDNDTLASYLQSASPQTREHLRAYLGASDEALQAALMRAAWRSVCAASILPLQDLLGLGADARMNTPGLVEGNWAFRLRSSALLGGDLAPFLAEEALLSGRLSG